MLERLSKCDKCGETRVELEYLRLEMTAYLCPGCGTIRVRDHRGVYPVEEESFPKPLIAA